MMTRTLAILALSLCPQLAGCSSPAPPDQEPLRATWCLGMDEPRAAVFEGAMREWNERTGRTSWRRDEASCSLRAWPVPAGDPLLHGHSAYTRPEGIVFEEGFHGAQLQNVALHELGHVAWLVHSDDERDIMWPNVTAVVHLSEGDLAEFAATNFGQ